MIQGHATWKFDDDPRSGCWYVALAERTKPPYRRQVHVEAILDIADDGTLAGIEIIDGMPEGGPIKPPEGSAQ